MPTFAGINPHFDLDRYPSDVRAAIRRLADHFYVTRSFEPEMVGNSQYFAALVRPTDETAIVLNTERELLVVFSRYDTFETRTLDSYRKFYDRTEAARVDQSIRFLVSADPNIETTIRHYIDQHPEFPIIVPITFDRLQREKDPVIGSIRRNFVIRDLFGFQSPLREEHFFFGRSEVVNSTIDFAAAGQHSSLFGLRKSGKTSTIYAVERKSKSSAINVVVVDCQDLAVHGRRFHELLVWLVHHVRSELSLKTYRKAVPTSPPEISEWFSEAMSATLSGLKRNLLIIFDEIENLSPGTAASEHWRNSRDSIYFWQVLRSFCQRQTKRLVSFCLVGTSPVMLESSKVDGIENPIYLLANKRFIPNLTFDETREMVTRLGFFMGLDFDAHSVARLHASYGGHPFFTRQVCSKIHLLAPINRPISVSPKVVQAAQVQFTSQLEGYLKDIVQNLKSTYPEEFRLLCALVDGNQTDLAEYMNEAPELVDHLLGYGLITAHDSEYTIAFSAVDRVVTALREDQEDTVSREERWSSACVRRNIVEQAIRSTLYFWSKSIAADVWVDVLKRALSANRFTELKSTEPAFLFSSKESPLYLSDLAGFLRDTRTLEYISDRRDNLTSAAMKANALRKESHANDFSDDEFERLCSALSVLEDEFVQP